MAFSDEDSKVILPELGVAGIMFGAPSALEKPV
jgi:hypothetical protein